MLKSMSWFLEKCGIQRHDFGRNVEINDMVLGAGAKWSELCGAKTPMMQRKGDKSQGEICFYKYTKTTTCMEYPMYKSQGGRAFTNTQRQPQIWIPHVNLMYTSCILHLYLIFFTDSVWIMRSDMFSKLLIISSIYQMIIMQMTDDKVGAQSKVTLVEKLVRHSSTCLHR